MLGASLQVSKETAAWRSSINVRPPSLGSHRDCTDVPERAAALVAAFRAAFRYFGKACSPTNCTALRSDGLDVFVHCAWPPLLADAAAGQSNFWVEGAAVSAVAEPSESTPLSREVR